MIRTLIAVAALALTYGIANPALAQDGSVGDQYASCADAPASALASCVIDQSTSAGDNGE
jgi:hypothetical protein